MATLDNFFVALCQRMGWEPTTWRIGVLKTMAQMEGYPSVIGLEQTWNPLDTMHPTGAVGNWNSAGVKIYPNLAAGVEATAKTLEQSNFTNLRETLRTQKVNQGTATDLQLWGWNSPDLLNGILNAMGGTTGQTTQGGAIMAGQAQETLTGRPQTKKKFREWAVDEGLITEPTTGTDPETGTAYYDPGGLVPGMTASMVSQLYQDYLTGGTAAGTATTTTTIPSAQETAIGQWDMETWLSDAIDDEKRYGLDVAATNFANKIAQAQEGRLQATAAQEYAQQLAPPGMTELKLGKNIAGIPLGPPVPSTYGGAMELAGQYVPQAPELQYQPGALPQMPNLAALPSGQQSTQVTVPYAGGGATLPNGLGGGGQESSLMQAIRNYIARFGQTFPGGQLPVGR